MLNSVVAGPVGAIVRESSFTVCPSWYVHFTWIVELAALPFVETTAKIVSFGLNVSDAFATFLSAPSELPSETSEIATAGAGVGTAVGTAVGSGGGGGGASFLHATDVVAARTRTRAASFMRCIVFSFKFGVRSSTFGVSRKSGVDSPKLGVSEPILGFLPEPPASVRDLQRPARLDDVGILDAVLVR